MKLKSFFLCLTVVAIVACKKDPDPIPAIRGCMDVKAMNYDSLATESDGNCVYAERYLPFAPGNYWILRDTITLTVPFSITVPVEISYTSTTDTLIEGKTYNLTSEVITASTFYNSSNVYAYRHEARTGKVYRRNITTGDSTDKLFMDYPLGAADLGKVWYDTPLEDGYKFTLVGVTTVTVPTGTYAPVVQIEAMQLSSSTVGEVYFAKNVGPVKAETTLEYSGLSITARPELVSFHVE